MRFGVGLIVLAAVGCTKPNPHACADGVCDDPQLPFCDTQGSLGGAVNECIAVGCTPGEFAECRGDTSVVCDASGANYELQQCVRGCDATTGGCHIDPSNDLGQYYDMVPDPPDMEIVSGTIDTTTGTIDGVNSFPNFLVAAPPGGVAIRLFVVRRARLVDVTVVASIGGSFPALAIIAREDISVENSIELLHTPVTAPGRIDPLSEDCARADITCILASPGKIVCGGMGGGGHASAGGAGGSITGTGATGAEGAKASGNETLVPLRGSCGSGSGARGDGGGAIQLSSMTKLRILGRLDVRGEPGSRMQAYAGTDPYWRITGGGAGGGVLLEAPIVELGPTARVLAKGGGGGSREGDGAENDGPYPSAGATCSLPDCGAGGDGASSGIGAQAGMSIPFNFAVMVMTAGGGGGGLGRLRINTADGTYVSSQTTIMAASTTSGQISRR